MDDLELEFLALADGQRRVRTPEGAKLFGQPIGTIITADMLAAKQAQGVSVPKDALTGGGKTATISTLGTTYDPQTGKMGKGYNTPTASTSGPNKFKVGVAQFSAPQGSTLIRAKGSEMAYIRTVDGQIKAYNAQGEVPIPESLKDILASKFGKNFKGDDFYEVEDFDESNEQKLKDMPIGTQLTKNGNVAFVKKEDGVWENPDIGALLSDNDLQSAYDKGQFEAVAPNVEETDFSSLSEEELSALLESYPEGKKLYFQNATLTKQTEGWQSSVTGKHLTTEQMVSFGPWLGDKQAPQDQNQEDPLEQAPEPVVEEPGVADPESNLVTPDEIWYAEPGESVFHKSKGELRKVGSSADAWALGDGTFYYSDQLVKSAELGSLSHLPWNTEQENALDPEPVISEKTWKLLAEGKKIQAIKQFRADNDLSSLKEAKDAIDNAWENDQEKINSYKTPVAVTKPANAPSDYDLLDAMPGATVEHEQAGELQMMDDGYWYNEYSEPIYTGADLLIENEQGKIQNLQANPEFVEPPAQEWDSVMPEDAEVLSTLESFKEGDFIYVDVPDGPLVLKKNAEGEWEDDNGYSTFSEADLSADLNDGLIYLPKQEDVPEKSSSPTLMSESQVKDAIDSLEAHSGFQIKYGLKSLPDTHPLKDQKYLDSVVADAKKSFATLSPKQALVKHLKASIGQYAGEPLADWEKELLGDTFIQIGAETSKMTATGVTGGKYAKEDIQKAIDLLENFDGKAFKAYLNKNGNPLGELSPNDIVGFNKDKTITKKNFVEMLKGKLGTDKPELAKAELVDVKVETPDSISKSDFNNLPVGTAVYNDGSAYEKTSDDQWRTVVNGKSALYFDNEDIWDSFKADSGWTFEEPEVSTLSGVEPSTLSKNQVKNLPVGTLAYQNDLVYEKVAQDSWKTDSNTLSFSDGEMHVLFVTETDWSFDKPENSNEVVDSSPSALADQAVDSPEVPDSGEALDVKAKPTVGQKVASFEDFQSLPVDSEVTWEGTYSDKVSYVKKEDGTWSSSSGATGISDDDFNGAITNSFLTYTKIPGNEAKSWKKGDTIPSMEDFKSLPIGTVVIHGDNTAYQTVYIKAKDKLWNPEGNPNSDGIAEIHFIGSIENGTLTYVSGPKKFDPMSLKSGDKISTQDEVKQLPEGTELSFFPKNSTLKAPQTFSKQSDGTWKVLETGVTIENDLTPLLPYMSFKSLPASEATEDTPDVVVSGIAPGKYNTGKGAKAHLWVKPDGTGVYQGMKGIIKPLDAEGVKKNYDAGMSVLADTPAPEAYPDYVAPTTSKIIPTLGTVDTLPDGTYESGGVTYVIDGDKLTSIKQKKSMDFSTLKVGNVVTYEFLNAAPVGTRVVYKYYASDPPAYAVKNSDGEWEAEVSGSGLIDYYFPKGGHSYYMKKWKVASFPETEEASVSKTTLKNKYLQGLLVDPETKNSVFPPGWTGSVTYAGGQTTVAGLSAYRDYMADPTYPLSAKASAHATFGIQLNPPLLKSVLLKKKDKESFGGQEFVDAIVEDIDEFLATANVPELPKPGDLFKLDSYGKPPKPELVAADTSFSEWDNTAGELSSYIETLSATVGDGSVIGQNMKGATKSQKSAWLGYFKQGKFAALYNVEVGVAKDKGKPLLNATMHPGHPLNKETHNISWGAFVTGEAPASEEILGNWSSLSASPSQAEVANYLMLAKMQNPTHLSYNERRNWYTFHRNGHQNGVDALSAKAQIRAKKGDTPLTPELVWTDNVEPAKSYTSMFDDTEFPKNWTTYDEKAWDFYNDVKADEPELVAMWNSTKDSEPYWDKDDVSAYVLNKWFSQKEEAYLEELNKPKYKVVQAISTGTHATYIIQDQFDRKKIFKPLTPGKEWRAENEVAAHNLAAQLGFNVPRAAIGDVYEGLPMGSNYRGIIMDFAPNVGSLGDVDGAPVDLKTMTAKQFGQLASEHVLDWFLDNDDTHSENILIGEAGEIVAIDKGRAFFQYGHWHGLNADDPTKLNINTQDSDGRSNVYHDMMVAVTSGDLSQEQVDAAYIAATRAAKRIQKSDDKTIELFVRSAMGNRNTWEIPDYAQNWDMLSPAPEGIDELVAAVLSRKNSMIEDVEKMWDRLYSDAGLTKPEPPAKLLTEDLSSGWEEADLAFKITDHKVWGVAPVMSSSAFVDGSTLLWTEKDTSDQSVVSGKFMLGGISQQKAVQFLAKKVSTNGSSGPVTYLDNYPTDHVRTWKKTVTKAAKDWSANVTSDTYDLDTWNKMKAVEKEVDVDLAHAVGIDTSSKEYFTFPSGVSMPGETVPQYTMALQYHKSLIQNLEQAKAEKVATDKNHFKDYQPPMWKVNGAKYISPEGNTYKELDGGNYIAVENGVASIVPDIPAAAKNNSPGWTAELPDLKDGKAQQDPEKYSFNAAGMFAGELGDDGEKKVQSVYSDSGHPGMEYRIDLPTGEKIFFRNGQTTNSVKSQRGMVRFHLSTTTDTETSLSNVRAYLEKWGLDFNGADEDSAETVYWRQMFRRIIDSNTEIAPPGVKSARKKLIDMRYELQSKLGFTVSDRDIPEAVGLTSDNEYDFWRSLAVEAFGADKVNSWVAEGKHLPQYQHLDMKNPEKKTGLPYYNRIDVDMDAIYAKGTLIAIGNNGKDDRHFDYIRSGGMSSTEERLRLLGYYKQGASSSSDQGTGGANSVFTRIAAGGAKKDGAIYGAHVVYWSPAVMAQTGTYSFPSDQYGEIDNQPSNNPYNPLESLTNHTSGGNETMVANYLSILDFMELMIFENNEKRLKAIEEFKKRGIESLRGVPIEDRLIMRVDLTKALKTVKEAWTS